ncbi:sensor histidine kinase [Parasegetibacter sp. NRK P23]|uniref:sensor histidine kinase n=1 Tax=Parasegetibacter sp. NRK P23 TaxID=2942999 RepID=UPI002044ACFC|nr:histidine kinase [Parasegetibacter sp. NRK P23]MCM5530118.1 histidine kinase [Parasegetibacter sp. NRK P23]
MLKKIPRYWLFQVAGWSSVTISYIFLAYTFNELSESIIDQLFIFITTGLATSHLLRSYIKQTNWLLLPVEKAMPRLLMALVVACLIAAMANILISNVFIIPKKTATPSMSFNSKLLTKMIDYGMFLTPWILIYYFYHYINKIRKQEVDTLRLEALVKELELKTIKSHINPHFIFNALNSIRALVDEDPIRARTAITELSNILRSSLQAEKQETVPLEKELNIVKDYLALEHIRFEDRLQVEYDIDEDTLDQPIPPMMLQTLVENAIKHGISKQVDGGLVRIISDFKDDHHELIIQNTGRLNGGKNGDGFGLNSTQNRLSLLFGEKSDFEIKEINGNMVEARVTIPVVEHY